MAEAKNPRRKPMPPKRPPGLGPFASKLATAFEELYAGLGVSRRVEFPDPGEHDAKSIRALRDRLRLTQRQLAKLMGVSVELVEHWEQGIVVPRPIARRLLDEITARSQNVSENQPAKKRSKPKSKAPSARRHPQADDAPARRSGAIRAAG